MALDTKGDWGAMTRLDYARFKRNSEKMFRGHRGLQNGRDFRWNVFRHRDEDKQDLDKKFDKAFPTAPGSPKWFAKNYCSQCGKRLYFCQCKDKGDGSANTN